MANGQYLVTEADVSALLKESGLSITFQQKFTKDYVAVKGDINDSNIEINKLLLRIVNAESDIDIIDDRLDTVESDIDSLEPRVAAAEIDIAAVTSNLSSHVADDSAHGATGNIVGTDDYCTLTTGGTVKLAASVANAPASTVSAVSNPNSPGVAYSQIDASTWVNMLYEHKANINQLSTDLNAAITQLNLLMSNSRAALQLDT